MLSRYLFYLRGHNKRNFSLLIFLLLFALSSSACGSGGSDDAQATLIALEAANAATNAEATIVALEAANAATNAEATIVALEAANAANNAEATIIALEAVNAANNAEATTIALEATIEAQNDSTSVPSGESDESPTPTIPTDNNNTSAQPTQTNPTPPPLPPKDGLFFDDFSNNNNGWNLTSDDNGSVGFVQQSLVLSSYQKSCVIAPIPNFKDNDEYYIESDVKVTNGGFIILGYAAGSEPLQYYKYGVVNYNYSREWAVLSFSPNNDVDNPLSTTTLGTDSLWENGQTFTLGMEALTGLYTLYLNGDMLAATQFKPEGNSVGLFACSRADNRSQEVRFDNLVVRRSR